MKVLNLIPAIVLLSSSAFASTLSTLNCKTEKNPQDVFSVTMENLGKQDMTFVSDEDDSYIVFKTNSQNAETVKLVDTLNGQGGDLRIAENKITFFGDAAGIDFAYLTLYKNTGYTRGYVRTEYSFGTENSYSKVSCQLVR